MHKGIILLVKGESPLEKVREFLDEYKDNVWDWYQIGERWNQSLAPMFEKFEKEVKKILNIDKNGMISQKEIDSKQSELQVLWKSLNGKGSNPYCNNYKLPETGNFYYILPLKDCINTVKKWQQTIQDCIKEEKKAEYWITRYNDWNMYGYLLGKAANLYQQKFCFDCNVFNIESYDYNIPNDIENYHAIMIYIHN